MNALTQIRVTAEPKWAIADSTCDITDNWNERSGETVNDNEMATAYFHNEIDGYDDDAVRLRGISVDDGHGPAWYNRARAISYLGAVTVELIEYVHSDVAFT